VDEGGDEDEDEDEGDEDWIRSCTHWTIGISGVS